MLHSISHSRVSACLFIVASLGLASCGNDSSDGNQEVTPAPLDDDRLSTTTTLNEDVILIEESAIQGSLIDEAEDLKLVVSTSAHHMARIDSVINYYNEEPTDTNRFPLGLSGRVTAIFDNDDGTSTLTMEPIEYADLASESTQDITVALDSGNYVGVITPDGVEPIDLSDEIGVALPKKYTVMGLLCFEKLIRTVKVSDRETY